MKFFFHTKIFQNLKLILTAVCLVCLVACQSKSEKDAALLAADKPALAEIKRINTNLNSGQLVSQADIDALNKLREKYKDAFAVRQTLQTALFKRGDWETAEKLIGEIPEAERTNADRLNLVRIYLKLGRFQAAADTLNNLPADKTIELETKSLLGQAQFYLGQNNEAGQTIDSVWNEILAQKKTEDITLRGMIYFREGNLDKAIETLGKAVEIMPDNIPANNALSRAYAAKGDTGRAEIHLVKAQKAYEIISLAERKKIKMVSIYYQIEDAYKAQKYEEVIRLANQTLPDVEEQNKAALYQYLARAYAAQGRKAEADNALAEAAKLTAQ